MLSSLSRYTVSVEERNGEVKPVSVLKERISSDYTVYTARDGDSFDLLANKFFGNPVFFWRIADLNPHVSFPDKIPAGTRIRIPTR